MYLVAACTDTSTPWSNERKPKGVAHELSMTTSAPRPCATAAIAGMSCTPNVSEPGDSVNTRRVLGRNSRSIAGPEQRIVIGDLDAEPHQVIVAEAPRRTVDRIGDEHVVARTSRARAAATSSR